VETTIEHLLKEHSRIKRYVCQAISASNDVEDLQQEIFIKAWKNLESFQGKSSLYSWLHKIAENTIKDFYLKKGQIVSKEIPFDETQHFALPIVNPLESEMARDELIARLNKNTQNLSQDYHKCLFLREIMGLSYQEIAKELACPVGTVRSRIHRARKFMVS
jgi:RNA polymerase sigma-70 factor (ECF subfamily)